jgi:multimeric flavodoxin WrbA
MIYTPLMIPNILIPRIDEVSREKYYVKFTPETISKIAKKFAIEGRNRKTNYEHSNQKFNDVVMVESWIVEGENDKAYQLGFSQEQIPVGTWMGGYYVLETPEGEDVWKNYIKNGKVRGASVEGNFILNFSALRDDDYLLGQIINILKNISENER